MIDVQNLSKSYGDFRAVDNITFTCRPGAVTGFLGPNGAGKSTALRMIVGLTPPSAGTATVGGVPYQRIPNPGVNVGVLLDASAQHAGRTGREVLTLGAIAMGLPRKRVDEMLELVGLTPKESKRRVRHYSLGMRQRLGIAHALLGDPQILILDEPANGLDPAGIHWMRGLLRHHAERGGTVLLSSHLLHEMEIIADELLVIGHGRIVAQGTKDELLTGSGILVDAEDRHSLGTAIAGAGWDFLARADGGFEVQATSNQLGRLALEAGLVLTELRVADRTNLEDLFLAMTSDTQREAPSTTGTTA